MHDPISGSVNGPRLIPIEINEDGGDKLKCNSPFYFVSFSVILPGSSWGKTQAAVMHVCFQCRTFGTE